MKTLEDFARDKLAELDADDNPTAPLGPFIDARSFRLADKPPRRTSRHLEIMAELRASVATIGARPITVEQAEADRARLTVIRRPKMESRPALVREEGNVRLF